MRELFQIWPASLTDEQINDIIESAQRQPEQDATIFASPEIVSKTRVSTIRWLSEQWLQDCYGIMSEGQIMTLSL